MLLLLAFLCTFICSFRSPNGVQVFVRTPVGKTGNTITYTEGTGFDEQNYRIIKYEGVLEITQNTSAITVTADSASKTYDGTPLTGSGSTVTGVPDGFTVTVTVEGSATNVSDTREGNNVVSSVKITKDGQDVTDQFANITKADGTLAIEKRAVKLTSASDSKAYDGTALTSPGVAVGGDKFVDGEVTDLKATGTITKVGSVANTITYTTTDAFKAGNYSIEKDEGTLTIRKADVAFRVAAPSQVWTYDGKTHTASEAEVTYPDEDSKAFTIQATVSGEVKSVSDGQVANKVTDVKVYLGDEDVTDQFDTADMVLVDGVLQVKPVEITLASETASKEYDGKPLEKPDVTVTGDIVKSNGVAEISNIRATGSVTYVTDVPVPNTIAYDTSSDFQAENYVLSKETGTLSITPNTTAVTVKADSASKTYDGTALTAPTVKVTGLPSGFTGTGSAGGSITNVPQTKEGNNPVTSWKILDKDGKDVSDQFSNVTEESGTLTILPRKITLTSSSAKKAYDGTPLVKEEVKVKGAEGLAHRDSVTYDFSGSQTYVGSSSNTFTYTLLSDRPNEPYSVADNYEVVQEYGTLEVTDDVDPSTVVTKKHDSSAYQAGDQIVFTIKVTNIYDTAQTIRLSEQEGVVFTGPNVFAGVAPGETVTTEAYHVVTAADIENGSYQNTVKASFEEAGKNWPAQDKEDQFAHLVLTKKVTSEPEDGTAYKLGETITYQVTVTNDGTAKLSRVEASDELTGEKWEIGTLAPGEGKTFETSYKVKEHNLEAGNVVNEAAASAVDPDGDTVTPEPASVTVPVEAKAPSLYVEKTSDKQQPVSLGETIHYTIRVLNNGNETLSDVTVLDDKTGDSWEVGTLAPGDEKTFETDYVVTEEDILAGSVRNVATATGKDHGGEEPNVTPGETEDETVPPNAHLTVTKTTTSKPADAAGYAVGETIRYQVVAANDGNLTLTDVAVEDPLTGETWTVDTLAPGETKAFETAYVVTGEDQKAGLVINDATAKGKAPGDQKLVVVPGQVSDPVLAPLKKVVATGDPLNAGTWLAVLLSAAAAAGGITVSAKRRKRR